jgi:hypothetical protein
MRAHNYAALTDREAATAWDRGHHAHTPLSRALLSRTKLRPQHGGELGPKFKKCREGGDAGTILI